MQPTVRVSKPTSRRLCFCARFFSLPHVRSHPTHSPRCENQKPAMVVSWYCTSINPPQTRVHWEMCRYVRLNPVVQIARSFPFTIHYYSDHSFNIVILFLNVLLYFYCTLKWSCVACFHINVLTTGMIVSGKLSMRRCMSRASLFARSPCPFIARVIKILTASATSREVIDWRFSFQAWFCDSKACPDRLHESRSNLSASTISKQ